MKAIVVPYTRPIPGAHAPLRRSLPAQAPVSSRRRVWPVSLLALAGIALVVDIEFGLAYLLYVASRFVG